MRVLFCTDGSKISYDALKNYINIAIKDTTFDAISVIDWSFLPDNVILEDSKFISGCTDIAQKNLEQAKDIIETNNFKCGELIKQCGAAVECILEQIEKAQYDTVILGSYGKKGFQKWLGSVSREVLESAKIPVYISKKAQCCKRVLFTTDGSNVSYNTAKIATEKLNLKGCETYICSVSENPELLFLNGNMDTNWMNAIKSQQNSYAQKSINLLSEKQFSVLIGEDDLLNIETVSDMIEVIAVKC